MSNPIQDIKKKNKTVFLSKLRRKITDKIYKLYELRNFNVLFILAKELPYRKDKQELIDSIIESSYLPLIIIVIGEGVMIGMEKIGIIYCFLYQKEMNYL